MATIKQFDRPTCRLVGDDVSAAMQAIAAKYELTVKYNGGRFDTNEFTPKFTFGTAGDADDTSGITPAARAKWEQYADVFNCNAAWLGQSFVANTKTMTIVGINPRASLDGNCVELSDQNGKRFRAKAAYVARNLKAS